MEAASERGRQMEFEISRLLFIRIALPIIDIGGD